LCQVTWKETLEDWINIDVVTAGLIKSICFSNKPKKIPYDLQIVLLLLLLFLTTDFVFLSDYLVIFGNVRAQSTAIANDSLTNSSICVWADRHREYICASNEFFSNASKILGSIT
jgi:hypothetical protein